MRFKNKKFLFSILMLYSWCCVSAPTKTEFNNNLSSYADYLLKKFDEGIINLYDDSDESISDDLAANFNLTKNQSINVIGAVRALILKDVHSGKRNHETGKVNLAKKNVVSGEGKKVIPPPHAPGAFGGVKGEDTPPTSGNSPKKTPTPPTPKGPPPPPFGGVNGGGISPKNPPAADAFGGPKQPPLPAKTPPPPPPAKTPPPPAPPAPKGPPPPPPTPSDPKAGPDNQPVPGQGNDLAKALELASCLNPK